MTDFNYLEEIAQKIKLDKQQLFNVDEELSKVNARIHELPRKTVTESAFARMIGVDYHDELSDLEMAKEKLVAQKDLLVHAVADGMSILLNELTSPELVIPLEPVPKFKDGNTIYSYRNGSKFSNLFDMLSELLGLSLPIVIKDVMLSPLEIVIKANDEFEAKRKFITTINEIQKTLSIKKR